MLDQVEKPEADAVLLALAEKLRDAAAEAGRPDVAAKAQEAVALVGRPAGRRQESDKANTVVRILDGLGF
jgi:hypothetical protein